MATECSLIQQFKLVRKEVLNPLSCAWLLPIKVERLYDSTDL